MSYRFEAEGTAYACVLGPGGDADADFGAHIANLRSAMSRGRLSVIVVLDVGHPVPSSVWRAEVRKLMGDEGFTATMAVVTSNPLIRGVLTALSWFIADERVTYALHPSVSTARAWLDANGAEVDALDKLLARAKADGAEAHP